MIEPTHERVYFVEHQGARILMLDFSGWTEPKPALEAVEAAGAFIQSQPERSLVTLTNVRNSKFNFEVAQNLWRMVRRNRPHVLAGAVVGIAPGVQQDLYHFVMKMSGRNLPNFDELDRAKDWLAKEWNASTGGSAQAG